MDRGKGGRFIKKKEIVRRQKVSDQAKLLVERARLKKKEEAEEQDCIADVGRRIVDLGVLAKRMWCKTCDIPLSFRELVRETQRGLASILHIRCFTCLDVIDVPTSTTVKLHDGTGYPLYAVNCKAAAGCLDSGVGHDQLNNFLSVLNCPIIHHKTMKRAEERVGRAFEAKDSLLNI